MPDTTTIIDSRELLAEYRDLVNDPSADYDDDPSETDEWENVTEEDRERALMLRDLLSDLPESTVDSPHGNSWGSTLIREDYFEEYAQEFAEDIGAISSGAGWPLYCIDWERAARELAMDYSHVELDGVTYLAR